MSLLAPELDFKNVSRHSPLFNPAAVSPGRHKASASSAHPFFFLLTLLLIWSLIYLVKEREHPICSYQSLQIKLMGFQADRTQKRVFYLTEESNCMPQTNEELPVENQK